MVKDIDASYCQLRVNVDMYSNEGMFNKIEPSKGYMAGGAIANMWSVAGEVSIDCRVKSQNLLYYPVKDDWCV